jgi:N,N'-diacetylchitobiose transport system permease protein
LGLAFLAALAAARFHFSGRKTLVVMLIVVQMVPLEALIIPIYLMLDDAGQTDQLTGIIVTYMTFVLPFTIWTLRGFIVNIPMELEEAAMVDGCTRAGAFRRILLPLVAPGLVATAVFSFILVWNDYLIAYVLLQSPEKQTLGIWLASFTTNHGTDWGGVMAGSTLYAIPVVVFFLLVQRRVVSGLTAGAVKG